MALVAATDSDSEHFLGRVTSTAVVILRGGKDQKNQARNTSTNMDNQLVDDVRMGLVIRRGDMHKT